MFSLLYFVFVKTIIRVSGNDSFSEDKCSAIKCIQPVCCQQSAKITDHKFFNKKGKILNNLYFRGELFLLGRRDLCWNSNSVLPAVSIWLKRPCTNTTLRLVLWRVLCVSLGTEWHCVLDHSTVLWWTGKDQGSSSAVITLFNKMQIYKRHFGPTFEL